MNLKDVEYMVKIEEKKGIIGAAGELFMTPSALNQQLLRLEKELDTPLFIRAHGNGWTPTDAGKVYLDAAREMLRMKRETYRRIQDMADIRKGTLSIGFPPERGSSMFTSVYPLFHREYPEIVVNSVEASVRKQQQLIRQGELELAFVTLRKEQRTDDCYETIYREEFVVAAPQKIFPGRKEGEERRLADFKDIPFALMYRESTISECVEDIFRHNNFHPEVLFEAAKAETILDMVAAGLCCGIVPESEIKRMAASVSFFYLPEHPSWQMEASWRKNTYVSKPAKRFLEIARDFWKTPFNRQFFLQSE